MSSSELYKLIYTMKQVILLLILGIIVPNLQAQVPNEDILGTSAEESF
jgi:hypothetical protein